MVGEICRCCCCFCWRSIFVKGDGTPVRTLARSGPITTRDSWTKTKHIWRSNVSSSSSSSLFASAIIIAPLFQNRKPRQRGKKPFDEPFSQKPDVQRWRFRTRMIATVAVLGRASLSSSSFVARRSSSSSCWGRLRIRVPLPRPIRNYVIVFLRDNFPLLVSGCKKSGHSQYKRR